MSRMMRFLTFCDKHGRAPPSVIAKAGRPTASLDPNDGPTGAEERRSIFAESPESPLSEPATTKDDVLTLEFDKRDVRELKHKRRELEEAKEEHGYWISILNEDPRDLETLRTAGTGAWSARGSVLRSALYPSGCEPDDSFAMILTGYGRMLSDGDSWFHRLTPR